MIVIMEFPIPTLSQETPTIKADPSDINVSVNKGSTEQTTVTIKSTYSVERTVIFQNDTSGTYPKVELYGQSMTVPAKSISKQGAIVRTGLLTVGSYDVTLTYYFQEDVNKNPVGTVNFHIFIYDRNMKDWPLKAEPKYLNISVPAGLYFDQEIKLTNLAGVQIKGELMAVNLKCIDVPYIKILGNTNIVLEKNKSTKIKVRIEGATTSSSTCYDLRIDLSLDNLSSIEQRDVVVFTVKTIPGIPLMVVLIIVVVVVVLIVKVLSKKKRRRP